MGRLTNPIVLSLAEDERFGADLAATIGAECAKVERQQFPDGERYQRHHHNLSPTEMSWLLAVRTQTLRPCLFLISRVRP